MRASGPLKLKIFVASDPRGDAAAVIDGARLRPEAFGVTRRRPRGSDAGTSLELFGEQDLRRFWTAASDFPGTGLMVLEGNHDTDAAPVA